MGNEVLLDALLSALVQEWMNDVSAIPDVICSHIPYGKPLAEKIGKLISRPVYIYDDKAGCLVIGDDVLTGGRFTRLVGKIQEHEAKVLQPVIVLADLSSNWKRDFSLLYVLRKSINKWTLEECPLCHHGSTPRRRIDLIGI